MHSLTHASILALLFSPIAVFVALQIKFPEWPPSYTMFPLEKRYYLWHPFCMILGFTLLSTNAILAWRLPFERRTQKAIHATLNFFALLSTGTGIFLMMSHFKENNRTHFNSSHSLLGIVAFVLFFVQWLSGFLSFVFPRLSDKPRAEALHYHRLAGVFTLLLSCAAIVTGISLRQYPTSRGPEPNIVPAQLEHALSFLACIAIFSVILIILNSLLKPAAISVKSLVRLNVSTAGASNVSSNRLPPASQSRFLEAQANP